MPGGYMLSKTLGDDYKVVFICKEVQVQAIGAACKSLFYRSLQLTNLLPTTSTCNHPLLLLLLLLYLSWLLLNTVQYNKVSCNKENKIHFGVFMADMNNDSAPIPAEPDDDLHRFDVEYKNQRETSRRCQGCINFHQVKSTSWDVSVPVVNSVHCTWFEKVNTPAYIWSHSMRRKDQP